MERVEYSFHTRVLDGGCGRGYCTANIDTELGIWTIRGVTGVAAGRFRGGQFGTRGGRVDVPLPHSTCYVFASSTYRSFYTSNPQTNYSSFCWRSAHQLVKKALQLTPG